MCFKSCDVSLLIKGSCFLADVDFLLAWFFRLARLPQALPEVFCCSCKKTKGPVHCCLIEESHHQKKGLNQKMPIQSACFLFIWLSVRHRTLWWASWLYSVFEMVTLDSYRHAERFCHRGIAKALWVPFFFLSIRSCCAGSAGCLPVENWFFSLGITKLMHF